MSIDSNDCRALDSALAYVRRGWSVVPIPHRSKNPGFKGWQQLRLKEDDLATRFNGQPQNIGVLLGEPSGWLIDVDLDHPRCVELADQFLPPTPAVFGRPGKLRSHRIYRVTAPAATKKHKSKSAGMLVELRSTGMQTVFPPSTHESGEPITWETPDAEPAMVDPDELLAAVARLANAVSIELGERPAPKSKPARAGDGAVPGALRLERHVDVVDECVAAMSRMQMVDQQDGSARLFAAACRCIEHDLADATAVAAIRQYEQQQPFPRAWTDDEIRDRLRDAEKKAQRGKALQRTLVAPPSRPPSRSGPPPLPEVHLPSGPVPITQSASELGRLMSPTGRLYARGGAVAEVRRDDQGAPVLEFVTAAAMASRLESVARLMKWSKARDGSWTASPAICNEATAKLIMQAEQFVTALPQIRLIAPCPVLIERDGKLIQITNYDRASGILARGRFVPQTSLPDAVAVLESLVSDFEFSSPPDRSRALAAFITPALVMSGLLGGRAPLDLGEADDSQAGKGFRNKLTTAIYNCPIAVVSQRKGGVGGMEESFDSALIRGATFISLDNIRSKVDSPRIESFLTEDTYIARTSYSLNVQIDPRRLVLMMTSNKAEITADLANRSSVVRIIKRPRTHKFQEFDEGNILDHVRAHHHRYLGAVFTIINAWFTAGRPTVDPGGHDFRPWAGTLGWIVEHLLHAAPLLEGHRETQVRIATPALNWLRDVARAVDRAERCGHELRCHEILPILEVAGVETPGIAADADLAAEQVRDKAFRAIGRQFGQCFRQGNTVLIDRYNVTRREESDEQGRMQKHYLFSRVSRIVPNVPECAPESKPLFPESPEYKAKIADDSAKPMAGSMAKNENDSGDSGRFGGTGSAFGGSVLPLTSPLPTVPADDLSQEVYEV